MDNRQNIFKGKIKRRRIKHGGISKIQVNKNCPKFILGTCWMQNEAKIMEHCNQTERKYLKKSFELIAEWIKVITRDKLGLKQLDQMFGNGQNEGEAKRNYTNAKAFFKFLSEDSTDIIFKNTKMRKPLSYLICLEKFLTRLANPNLVYKLQFK